MNMTASVTHGSGALRGKLLGRKIFLRPFLSEDITSAYIGWLRDPDVMKFSNQRFQHHTKQTCEDYHASFSKSGNYFLAVCDRVTSDVLGTLTVYLSAPHETADLGVMIGDRNSWGQGIGADVFLTVISAIERGGQVRKITAGAMSKNIGMIRVMEKACMHHEATRYKQELLDGIPVDVLYYAKFCNE